MTPQSVLLPASRGAELLSELSWVLFVGGALIFTVVMALTARAVLSEPKALDARRLIVAGGVIFPAVVLTVLLAYGLFIGAALSHAKSSDAMRVHLIGKRWWWEVHYESADGSGPVLLANELHLPAGCAVELTLTTDNVIHSFWVPALAGKIDMIPGNPNRLIIEAQREGVYRGQCAEYCGDQHAQMALDVIVEPPQDFRQWLIRQAQPAVEPSTALLLAGRSAFFTGGCAACHTIRGTSANGKLGPDLTHVGSRRSLAAGMLRNHTATLAGWIVDAQSIKPGSLMPSMNVISGPQLRALVAYLENLE